MFSIFALFGCLTVVAPLMQTPTAQPDATPATSLRPTQWLVIDSIDERGRRPVRPDAVFAAHLLDPASPPPQVGQELTGESGTAQWHAAPAGEAGGPIEGGAYAFCALIAPHDGVYLARLSGAWQLYVNGRPHLGDAYRYGFAGVPVELHAGANQIYVTGARGAFDLEFTPATDPVLVCIEDMTLPDVVARARPADGSIERGSNGKLLVGLPMFSCSAQPLSGLAVSVGPNGAFEPGFFRPLESVVQPLAPVSVTLELECQADLDPAPGERLPLELFVSWSGSTRPLIVRTELQVKQREAPRLVTFRSAIDDSVQEYGLREALESPRDAAGLVVSLHGASVEARNQIEAYSSKAQLGIVAPTNRRPYGFDWQDWGRMDVYEVIEHYGAHDARRRYLTGHSMGGHGTWHLAANDPGLWSAIAPSAGWQSFDTYGSRPQGALREVWHAADAASRTIDHIDALAQLPIFLLHGADDETVPAQEAHDMERLLRAASAELLEVHYEPGVGHWWDGERAPGADCVDWPGIWDLFERAPRTARPQLRTLGADAPEPLRNSFKRAFSNRFVLVVGTAGDAALDEALLDQARFDAQGWWYRANGSAPLLTDEFVASHPESLRDRNWVLYGDARSNLAWEQLSAGSLIARARDEGALESALVLDVFEQAGRQIGCFRSEDTSGARLHSTLAHFVSGAGFPDHLALSARVLIEGDGGVVSAGWRSEGGELRSAP